MDKNNGAIGVLALRALDQLDPEMATRRSRAILDSLFPYPPVVVVLCAGTLLERIAELEKLGYMTTPVTVMDGDVVVGFDRAKLEILLQRP